MHEMEKRDKVKNVKCPVCRERSIPANEPKVHYGLIEYMNEVRKKYGGDVNVSAGGASETPAPTKPEIVPNTRDKKEKGDDGADWLDQKESPSKKPKVQTSSSSSKGSSFTDDSCRSFSRREEDPTIFIGRRIGKIFENKALSVYYGTVKEYRPRRRFWYIKYDDGDIEEFDENELKSGLFLSDFVEPTSMVVTVTGEETQIIID